jgi:ABC-2 type transport system permease protein
MFSKIYAFIKRDVTIATSYKLSFFLRFFGMFFSVLVFYFINKLFGSATTPYLKAYGGDYFSFVLIGIAFTSFLWAGLKSFSKVIRRGQMMGTLEAMLITPTRISTIILFSSLWSFIATSVTALMYLGIGGLFFGVDFGSTNILSATLVLGLTIIAFSSFGILSASFIMIYKEGDPINWLFSSTSSLLGGVFFPIDVMPQWLQNISRILPITYSLDAMRLAILKGYSPAALTHDILPLIGFSAIVMPFAIVSFYIAVNKAKMNGSLTHY